MRRDDPGAAAGAGLAPWARVETKYVLVLVVPAALLVVAAMVVRLLGAYRSGDSAMILGNTIGAALAAAMCIAAPIVVIVLVRRYNARARRRIELLAKVFPDALGFLFDRPIASIEGQAPPWSAELGSANAVVLDGTDVVYLRVGDAVEVLGRAPAAELVVGLTYREVEHQPWTELTLSLPLPSGRVIMGVLPLSVREFALPRCESLNDLIVSIRSRTRIP